MKRIVPALLALFLGLGLPTAAQAVLMITLGSQNFTDGTIVGTGTFNTAVAGNPAPFNGFTGSDISGPNFSATWTFSYASLVDAVSSGSLTLGILDADSKATGSQVASFTLNGIDLTSELNTAFESHGGATGEYDVYSFTLPSSTFSALASGTVTFALTLMGPGLGVLGETSYNGAGIDFSTLSVETTSTPPPAAEPGTLALLFPGLLPLGLMLRRRNKS